jgi:hypothetical protein
MAIDNTIIGALLVVLLGVFVFSFITWSNTRNARKHTRKIYQQQQMVRIDQDAHRLFQAMHLLRPEARLGFDYTISQDRPGELPYILEWNTGGERPTQAEIDDALDRVTRIDSTGYAAMRRSEYPSIEDQLDAAFKARRGDDSEQQELDNRIAEIKSKYPKPGTDV